MQFLLVDINGIPPFHMHQFIAKGENKDRIKPDVRANLLGDLYNAFCIIPRQSSTDIEAIDQDVHLINCIFQFSNVILHIGSKHITKARRVPESDGRLFAGVALVGSRDVCRVACNLPCDSLCSVAHLGNVCPIDAVDERGLARSHLPSDQNLQRAFLVQVLVQNLLHLFRCSHHSYAPLRLD